VHGNIQDAALDLETMFVQAVLAIGQSKKPDLQNFNFSSAGGKKWGVLS
jgi:hypothetical protein